jgi:hypothetical protein
MSTADFRRAGLLYHVSLNLNKRRKPGFPQWVVPTLFLPLSNSFGRENTGLAALVPITRIRSRKKPEQLRSQNLARAEKFPHSGVAEDLGNWTATVMTFRSGRKQL